MNRVSIRPELLRWACDRAGLSTISLERRFPHLPAWLRGETQPTFKQLEDFARATHAPIGYLFLSVPPRERLPIPDFRTFSNERVEQPSADLLDTLYLCQQRQHWYREFARSIHEPRVDFVSSGRATDGVETTAASIRERLRFDLERRREMPTWTDALRRLIDSLDQAGVLVMVSGVVGSNNRRALDPREFRGFTLVDDMAPLVFINGSDPKAAQMFTFAHEVAHVWIGQSAVSDSGPFAHPDAEVERWCSEVAAELLVPRHSLLERHDASSEPQIEAQRLARELKVSTLVALRRMHDTGLIGDELYGRAYDEELKRIRNLPKGTGGNFYLSVGARVGKRFARSLVASTLEGRSSYTEAFRLLGFAKMATFRELGRTLGLAT